MSKKTLAASVLGNHTVEEREDFVQRHLAICTRSMRRPRYNTKTAGRALRGTMSVHMAKRHCATKQWKKKIRRELARDVAQIPAPQT